MSQRPDILLTFAVKEEAKPAQLLLCSQTELRVLVTGIGEDNALRTIRASLANQPARLVITSGFAGGLDPQLAAGTVIFEADSDFPWSPALLSAGARPVRFHCSKRVIISPADKANLRRTTGADAVEMESKAIRTVCRQYGIPSATVRVISDSAHEDLPLDFNLIFTPEMRINPLRLLAAILRSPAKIIHLVRFQHQTTRGAQRLAETLFKVIEMSSPR
jgi:adenosylhomocysteine nucleosidase